MDRGPLGLPRLRLRARCALPQSVRFGPGAAGRLLRPIRRPLGALGVATARRQLRRSGPLLL